MTEALQLIIFAAVTGWMLYEAVKLHATSQRLERATAQLEADLDPPGP